MTDFIKKAFLAGLGVTAATLKVAEKELNRLVDQGKLNAADADRFLDTYAAAGRKQLREYRKSLQEAVAEIIAKSGVARKREVEDLRRRLAALEKKVTARAKTPQKKSRAKK